MSRNAAGFTFFLLFLLFADSQVVRAQFGLGLSYEIRDEKPTHGIGARLDYDVLKSIPLVSVTVRAHASYFSVVERTEYVLSGLRTEVIRETVAYDVGASLLAGVRVALVKPYVGIGLGMDSSQFFSFDARSGENRFVGISEENLYWNAFAGAEFVLIPIVNPFIEYRTVSIVDPRNIDYTGFARVAFGIMLRF